MANEFVARRGIIAQSGGARITGSLLVSGGIDATGYNVIAQSFTGSFSGSLSVADSASYVAWNNIDNKPANLVSSSTQVQAFLPDGTVSSSAQVVDNINGQTITPSTVVATTISGSTISGSFVGDGSQLTGIATTLAISGSTGTDLVNLKTEALNFAGSNGITATVTDNTVTINLPAGSVTSSAQVKELLPDGTVSSSAQYPGWVTSSGQIDITATNGYSTFSSSIATKNDEQDISIQALNNLTGSYATTGSNNFNGIQTITDGTNSTNYTDGALVVQGGVGIEKDVNISGSLTVTGLLTAVSMSTQYVTSSQYTVGTSRIILNDDDLVRFSGLSVVDSGSTAATGSLLWDSFKNHWIYEREDGGAYKSSVIIAGPKNYGTLGDEEELVSGRIPVATGGDHIDTNAASSSIYIDFTDKKTYVEAGLYITGSVTSSVGFKGDGSQLTGIVTTLSITGSDTSTDTIDLKTSGLTFAGSNGVAATVANDTVTISIPAGTVSSSTQVVNSLPTDTVSSSTQVVAFLPGGTVSSSAQYAGWVTSSAQIDLASITGTTFASADFVFPQQLTVNGVLSGSTSAFINNTLYSGSIVSGIVGPVTNQVVSTLSATNYDAAHFDYMVKDGTNYRTGTVLVVWDGTNVEFTDTSTNDIGNTSDVSFTADINSGLVRLKITTGASTWTIKTTIRAF